MLQHKVLHTTAFRQGLSSVSRLRASSDRAFSRHFTSGSLLFRTFKGPSNNIFAVSKKIGKSIAASKPGYGTQIPDRDPVAAQAKGASGAAAHDRDVAAEILTNDAINGGPGTSGLKQGLHGQVAFANSASTKTVAPESESGTGKNISSSADSVSSHENVDASIAALKKRIDTNPERLEKDLEYLHDPAAGSAKKPSIADFKWPLVNVFLLASIVYYVLQYTWERLDYDEKEAEYKKQVEQLEAEVHALQEESARRKRDIVPESTEKKSTEKKSTGWRRFFWL